MGVMDLNEVQANAAVVMGRLAAYESAVVTVGEETAAREGREVIARLLSEVERLRGGLEAILREHAEDTALNPHHCVICGAADGYWPCVTVLEALAALEGKE